MILFMVGFVYVIGLMGAGAAVACYDDGHPGKLSIPEGVSMVLFWPLVVVVFGLVGACSLVVRLLDDTDGEDSP